MAGAQATRLLGCAALPRLGRSDLDVFGVCLGGNVFGWTADEARSFEVLDSYLAAGGNFIDSSDSYSAFVPGNQGGESETVLGNWFGVRGNRADVILATKVGRKPDRLGLSQGRPGESRQAPVGPHLNPAKLRDCSELVAVGQRLHPQPQVGQGRSRPGRC
jgi:aryl-alcohol dehydrogenase-like predicted oxidoreductase